METSDLCQMIQHPSDFSLELLEYLMSFISEERKERFDNVLANRTRHVTIAMENSTDGHNTSAVMRSCECFGVQDIHVIENGSYIKPAKNVTNGAYKWLTINRYSETENNTLACIQSLRSKGYRIVATTPHIFDKAVHELDISKPVALFFGQERDGISEILMQEADEFAIIPMQGFSESFNVSVAASIMLYDLTQRLRANTSTSWKLTDEEIIEIKKDWTLKSIFRPELLIRRFQDEKHQSQKR